MYTRIHSGLSDRHTQVPRITPTDTETLTHTHTELLRYTQMCTHSHIQSHSQTDTQIDTQADTDTNTSIPGSLRQTYTHMCRHSHAQNPLILKMARVDPRTLSSGRTSDLPKAMQCINTCPGRDPKRASQAGQFCERSQLRGLTQYPAHSRSPFNPRQG